MKNLFSISARINRGFTGKCDYVTPVITLICCMLERQISMKKYIAMNKMEKVLPLENFAPKRANMGSVLLVENFLFSKWPIWKVFYLWEKRVYSLNC